MNPQDIIPALDPNPLPAPYWFLKLLLLITFLFHILAMNFMLGSSILAAVARFKGKKNENYYRLFRNLIKKIPNLLPATITLGVAPLLFVQVIYGQFFYTSTILIGWYWFSLLIFLALAYYGFYFTMFKAEKMQLLVSWVLLASIVLVTVIGFIYSNNVTLLSTPKKWADIYFTDPTGWNLNLYDLTLYPRFLHFFTASLAMGGLLVALIGTLKWKHDESWARFLIRIGGKWFMYLTMIQFAIGIWFLISLPRDKMMLFMGDNMVATVSLLIGIFGGLAAIFLMSGALQKADPRRGFYLASGVTLAVIIFMIIMRDTLRDAFLAPYFKPEMFIVQTQWAVLPLFLLFFIAGVILWIIMMKQYNFFTNSEVKQK